MGFEQLDKFGPLFWCGVDAGGVMAAGVEQDDAFSREIFDGIVHAVEIQSVGFRVIIGIGLDGETGGLENLAMIFPAWIADPDRGLVEEIFEEVGADFQGACAAQSLHGDCLVLCDSRGIGSEEQDLNGFVISSNAVDREIAFGCFLFEPSGFCVSDGGQDGDFSGAVLVDADAQGDFFGVLVGIECFCESQDRVRGGLLNLREK